MDGEKIVVSPKQLEDAALELRQLARRYRNQYRSLFDTLDETKTCWNGEDNLAFIGQLKHYEDQLEAVAASMNDYAAHLETSAQQYRATGSKLAQDVRIHRLGE